MEKRRAIFDKHRKNADILVLQETHSESKFEKYWENEWGGKIIFLHGTSAARGIAICTSNRFIVQLRILRQMKKVEQLYVT